jgi:hypothetical protein
MSRRHRWVTRRLGPRDMPGRAFVRCAARWRTDRPNPTGRGADRRHPAGCGVRVPPASWLVRPCGPLGILPRVGRDTPRAFAVRRTRWSLAVGAGWALALSGQSRRSLAGVPRWWWWWWWWFRRAGRTVARGRGRLRTCRLRRRGEAAAGGATTASGEVSTPRAARWHWSRRLPAGRPRLSLGRRRVRPRTSRRRGCRPRTSRRRGCRPRTSVGAALGIVTSARWLVSLRGPATADRLRTSPTLAVRLAVSGRRAGSRAGPLTQRWAGPFGVRGVDDVVACRPDVGTLLLGGTQVVDPAELLAPRLLVGRLGRSAATPSPTPRFVGAVTGLLGTG